MELEIAIVFMGVGFMIGIAHSIFRSLMRIEKQKAALIREKAELRQLEADLAALLKVGEDKE